VTRPLALSALSLLLAGCDLFSKATPDAAGTPDAAVDAQREAGEAKQEPGSDAVNKAKVARFGDEQKIEGGEVAKILSAANAYGSPPAVDLVQGLKPGTEVTKIALHDEHVLIVFQNAKGENVIGWVAPGAFRPATSDTAIKGTCKTDRDCKGVERCVLMPNGAQVVAGCAVECNLSKTPPCAEGLECTGEGKYDGGAFPFCWPTKNGRDGGADAGPAPRKK
jgi:hypothetical protein